MEENDNMITRENLDDFITYNVAPDIDDNDFEHVPIPTTDSGELPFTIGEEIPNDRVHVSGHVN